MFLIAIGLLLVAYVGLLLWCFAPLFRWKNRGRFALGRIALGLYLLIANAFPAFIFIPIMLAALFAGPLPTGDRLFAFAIALAPAQSVSRFVQNISDRQNDTASILHIAFPIEIAGVMLRPRVQAACVTRRVISFSLEGGMQYYDSKQTTIAHRSVQELSGATVALYVPPALCNIFYHAAERSLPYSPRTPAFPSRAVVEVVREQDAEIDVYIFGDPTRTLSFDGIKVFPPEIVDVSKAQARDVVPLTVLWPAPLAFELEYPAEWLIARLKSFEKFRDCLRVIDVSKVISADGDADATRAKCGRAV